MAIHFDEREGDVWAGVIGYRAPDGSVIRTVKFYREAEEPPARPTQLTEDEKAVSDGVVRTMVELFGKYVREAKALDKKGFSNFCKTRKEPQKCKRKCSPAKQKCALEIAEACQQPNERSPL